MRVLVCGGRRFSDYYWLNEVLSDYHVRRGISVVIHGGASGADRLAGRWAQAAGVEVITFSAKWWKYGRAAGPIRNRQMLVEGKPDVVIAFPGGRGTADMVALICPK